jgi:hypothetical protein
MSERWWMKCAECGVDLDAVPWWKRPWCAIWHPQSVPTCKSLEALGDTPDE